MTPSVYYATLRIDLDHFQPMRPPAADGPLATYRDFPVSCIQTVILLQRCFLLARQMKGELAVYRKCYKYLAAPRWPKQAACSACGMLLFWSCLQFFGSRFAFTGAAQQGVEHAAVVQIVVVFAFMNSCSLMPFCTWGLFTGQCVSRRLPLFCLAYKYRDCLNVFAYMFYWKA